MEVAVWSRERPPEVVRPAPGFAANVGSGTRVLAAGGWVIAATEGSELIGYASGMGAA